MSIEFQLYQVRHGKCQHLYVSRTKVREDILPILKLFSSDSHQKLHVSDSLGLVVHLTMAGLAMFLLVLLVSFLGTKIIVRSSVAKSSSSGEEDTDLMVAEAGDTEETDSSSPQDIFTISQITGRDRVDAGAVTQTKTQKQILNLLFSILRK